MSQKSFLRKFLSAASILVLAVIASVRISDDAIASDERLITVMNPAITEKLVPRVPLAPRLDTLEGKTIYLVDMNYEGLGRTPVLEEMQSWFAKNMPDTKIVFKLKSGSYISDDPALWKEIATNKGKGVVLGVAG